MTNLVILAGIPGCGKSTWAKTFFDLKYAIVSSDEIRKRLAGSLKTAHGEGIKPWDVFYGDIETRLNHGIDVIADATFLTGGHRKRARDIAQHTGAYCHLVLFTNIDQARRRNAGRDEDAYVPENVMLSMMQLFMDTSNDICQEVYDSVTTIASVENAHSND